MKNYLPSKKFMLIIGVGLVLIASIFLIFFFYSKKQNYTAKNSPLQIGHQTVTGLMEADTDGDGVPDWEESLWGTDPNNTASFNNTPDATYIAEKKKSLNIDGTGDEASLTETDKFAREFFAAFTAMKTSGQVDSANINNFSSALGQKISNPALIDQYILSDVKTDTNNTIANQKKYYTVIQKLFDKYKTAGLGDELVIIGDQLSTPPASPDSSGTVASDTQAQAGYGPVDDGKLMVIAQVYQDFAKNLIQLSMPSDLAQLHLQIANAANNTGISVANMTKVTADPVVGLSGLSQYQKYSNDLINAATNLKATIFK